MEMWAYRHPSFFLGIVLSFAPDSVPDLCWFIFGTVIRDTMLQLLVDCRSSVRLSVYSAHGVGLRRSSLSSGLYIVIATDGSQRH